MNSNCRSRCDRFAYHLFVRQTLEVVQLVDQSISWIPICFEVDEDEALWSRGKEQADNTGKCFRAGKQIVRLPAALAKEIKGQISP